MLISDNNITITTIIIIIITFKPFWKPLFQKNADRQPCHKTLHMFSEIIRGNIWSTHAGERSYKWNDCDAVVHTDYVSEDKYGPCMPYICAYCENILEIVTFRIRLLIHQVAGLHASHLHNSFSDPGQERSNIHVMVEDVFLSKSVISKTANYWNYHLPTLIGSSSTDETN